MMKIEANGEIVERVYHNEFGQLERREFLWENFWGEEESIAIITSLSIFKLYSTVVEVGQVIHLGRLRLRVIKREPFNYYVMRDGWRAWVYYWLVRGTWWVESAYRRAILTAVVWGLAEYEAGRLPSWRDLRLRKR